MYQQKTRPFSKASKPDVIQRTRSTTEHQTLEEIAEVSFSLTFLTVVHLICKWVGNQPKFSLDSYAGRAGYMVRN